MRASRAIAVWSLVALATLSSRADEFNPSPKAREQLFAELARDVAALEQQGSILKRVVKLATPSVAHIEVRRDDSLRSKASSPDEAGSGVVIDWAGKHYLLTNRHVIKNSTSAQIQIKLSDGRKLRPTRIWADRETDIAVLGLAESDLTAARLGDSSKLEIGDFVLAVGSPFGLSHSVTYGIISAKGRRDLQLGDDGVTYQDFLQTDAAINPGNSGGPLLNLRGEVIGVNTAIASSSGGSEGIGFTIPINMAMTIARQLIDDGIVTRAFLGVHLDASFTLEEAVSAGLNRVEGARVTGITPGSPAEKARLQPGDIILEFDGRRIEDDDHLINLVTLTAVDTPVALLVIRDGQTVRVTSRVGNRTMLQSLETGTVKP